MDVSELTTNKYDREKHNSIIVLHKRKIQRNLQQVHTQSHLTNHKFYCFSYKI